MGWRLTRTCGGFEFRLIAARRESMNDSGESGVVTPKRWAVSTSPRDGRDRHVAAATALIPANWTAAMTNQIEMIRECRPWP